MATLPVRQNTTVNAIYKHYEKREQFLSWRLGAGGIGKDCPRSLWYDLRWASRKLFDGRMLRLFETGHREELRMLVDLRNAGIEVRERDENGKQFKYHDAGGHLTGKLDGAALGIIEAPTKWHVVECKTHNEKSFKAVVKDGVRNSKPLHFAQANWYMGETGMKDAAYMAHNKNTDELHIERIKFDGGHFDLLVSKANRVIASSRPLTKISNKADSPECKYCDHNHVCHVGQAPAVSCRTCVHSTPVQEEGSENCRWTCTRYGVDILPEQQQMACESHLFIPDLLPYADVQDAAEEWIAYRHRDNKKYFVNATKAGRDHVTFGVANDDFAVYESGELSGLHPNLVGDEQVEELRADFDAKVLAPVAAVVADGDAQQLKEMTENT